MSVVEEISVERARQINAEGWTPEHDDAHNSGEMANAAAAYARRAAALIADPDATPGPFRQDPPPWWPWDARWWKPGPPRRNLIKAAALIVAEIERLDRRASRPPTQFEERSPIEGGARELAEKRMERRKARNQRGHGSAQATASGED